MKKYPSFACLPLLALALTLGSPARTAAADLSHYPSASISNQLLKATFFLPDPEHGYYRGTRFDWSGIISSVDFAGHTFFSEFKTEHDPLNHDDICGPAEEFSMTTLPPGFADAKPGEPFVKIGIGVLQRDDSSEYAFWKKYKIVEAGAWQITRHPDSVEFSQSVKGPGGWRYAYNKIIRLAPRAPVLTITRHLQNTGSQTIDTDHYGHNFLRIDDVPAGPDYVFEFPFNPRFGPKAEAQGCVEIKGHSLLVLKPFLEPAVWTPLEGFSRLEDNRIRLLNRKTQAALSISTDQPLIRLVLYSSGGVLCPEPFAHIVVPPGQTKEWTTSYQFSATETGQTH